MLYTRKGDAGTSGLYGTKERFAKDHPLYEALGTVDELNSLLGLCRAHAAAHDDGVSASAELKNVQEALFIIQAELAGTDKHLTHTHIDDLERATDHIEELIPNPHAFVLPGATPLGALFDVARAVARRAERAVISARATRPLAPESLAYLNRLSSLLYALARHATIQENGHETSPSY